MRIILCVLVLGAAVAGGCTAEATLEGNEINLANHMPGEGGGTAFGGLASAIAPGPSGNAVESKVLLADAASDPAAVRRAIVYQAGLKIVVPDIAAAQREVLRQAEAAGGYLQEMDGPAISVRVPVGKFDPVLSAVEKLGEVTQRHVKANDVTEEMRDLTIRLENSEAVRKRLAELVEKSPKMEDTIKLEQELERVTQTIELLKGKIQFLQSQVALSTIRAEFNSPLPQQQAVMALPFAWVRELADGAVAGVSENSPDTSRMWRRNERFVLPAGFVRYYERDHVTEAMSADEVVIKLRRQDNYDGGAVDFWKQLARRVLVENRAIAMSRDEEVQLKDGTAGRLLGGVKDFAGKKQGYVLGIAATGRYVYTFEAWGEQEKMEKDLPALEAALATLDVKHW